MLRSAQKLLKTVFVLLTVALIGAVTTLSPAYANDRSSLILRLQELRSTSPESGIFRADAASFNVAATDAIIEDLQGMSEHLSLGMQSENPEIRDISNKWEEELEGFLSGAQEKRSRLVQERLASLRSTSRNSGIR